MLLLFDMGTNFSMQYNDERTTIRYGEFALAMANVDFNELTELINVYLSAFTERFEIATVLGQLRNPSQQTLDKYKTHGILPTAVQTDIIAKMNFVLFGKIYDYLSNAYLSSVQKKIIAKLFIEELEKNICADSFNWMDSTTYIPQLLMDKELKESLEDILLKKSDFLSKKIRSTYTNNHITTSIRIDKKGIPRTAFHIENTLSYILLDLQKTLSNNKKILRCQNPKCQKLFYPISNKNKTYCRFEDPVTNLTCDKAVRLIPSDDFALKARQARGIQQQLYKNAKNYKSSKYIYDYDLLEKHYANWLIECSEQMEKYRQLNDLTGFENWIDDTKYTANNLEKFGIRFLKKEDSTTNE